MSASIIEIITLCVNSLILIFISVYILRLHAKQKEIEKKETKVDSQYHEVVNDALVKERKILDDAAHAADEIMTGAHYVNRETKSEVLQALRTMSADIHSEAKKIAADFLVSYKHTLSELSSDSLLELKSSQKTFHTDLMQQMQTFKEITESTQSDLQNKIKEFHDQRLASLEKEIQEYKKTRLAQCEKEVSAIVQKASQDILNKSINIEDHQKLVLESFEKAKSNSMFD